MSADPRKMEITQGLLEIMSPSPKYHINLRILHSDAKAQDKRDSRNHAL